MYEYAWAHQCYTDSGNDNRDPQKKTAYLNLEFVYEMDLGTVVYRCWTQIRNYKVWVGEQLLR